MSNAGEDGYSYRLIYLVWLLTYRSVLSLGQLFIICVLWAVLVKIATVKILFYLGILEHKPPCC
ncbi:hypothetical protein AsAng_0033700 [Aureispira anguillae]|uniref:Uncharacterized protein n=1 Tax=Aureispira anguillae TaxID=2864201 RepID=A0A915YGM8_9BACT|nr:hypothetical protein AsAng_0033700 [Aureispira anguillae]